MSKPADADESAADVVTDGKTDPAEVGGKIKKAAPAPRSPVAAVSPAAAPATPGKGGKGWGEAALSILAGQDPDDETPGEA